MPLTDVAMRNAKARPHAIAPGHIAPPIMPSFESEARDAPSPRRDITPLGVSGDAWDMGSAALFRASDEACFITGQHLVVDRDATTGGLMVAPMTFMEPSA